MHATNNMTANPDSNQADKCTNSEARMEADSASVSSERSYLSSVSSSMDESNQHDSNPGINTHAIFDKNVTFKLEGECIEEKPEQDKQHAKHDNSHRSVEDLIHMLNDVDFNCNKLTNEEILLLVRLRQIPIHRLESYLGRDNASRCVELRRAYYKSKLAELDQCESTPVHDRSEALCRPRFEDLEYERVNGACCENVIGHVKLPVGLAGPLLLDDEEIYVPLATTEGCLVASTCRGLSALHKSRGVTSRVRRDFMTRAPIVRFVDARLADALANVDRALEWLEDKTNKDKMRDAFNSTTSHGRFIDYTTQTVGREIHIRFRAHTGDAMGMNMCSKGVECALREMQRAFPTMKIVTLSGNMCTDKKSAAINWITGRGKSIECVAELPAHIVQQVLKVSVDTMVDIWKSKVMVGSALAASTGGFNCQAANIVAAIFIATGQDPAQTITSSNCILVLDKNDNGSLEVCCSMPSIECGTVGGGTILSDQSRYLQMMGIKGPTPVSSVSNNAQKLARIVCATVMAAELSLLASLAEGTLVKSHMTHNRSSLSCKLL